MIRLRCWIALVGSLLTVGTQSAVAFPVADDTLGTEVIRTDSDEVVIDAGTTVGQNLFHSFKSFDIDAGEQVYFFSAGDINNIFSRVTNGNPSTINGVLGSFGSDANLFLINPSGLVFGSDASLDVQGSFLATTANAVYFGSEGLFIASNSASDNLLDINPSSFFFAGQNQPSKISVAASAIRNSEVDLDFEIAGLQVVDGESLVLLGGDININNGTLRAFSGNIDIVSVAETGAVGFNSLNNTLLVPEEIGRSNVTYSNNADTRIVSTIPAVAGNLRVFARNLTLSEGSRIFSGVSQSLILSSQRGRGSSTFIDATGAVQLSGESFIGNSSFGRIDGGDINISAQNVSVIEGSQISAAGVGTANVGSVTITATESISFSGVGPESATSSGILASIAAPKPSDTGNSGNILLDARQINITDRALITSGVALGAGNAGNIQIQSQNLLIAGGGGLLSSTLGAGNAGNILVTTSNNTRLENGGKILSSVNEEQRGRGGNITIATNSLEIVEGSSLDASTSGTGVAGEIVITAPNYVLVSGVSANEETPSAINTTAKEGSEGNGGSIHISTNNLSIVNGAELIADTLGEGSAGNIILTSRERMLVSGLSRDGEFFSRVSSTAEDGSTGAGGTIQISAGSLEVLEGARLVSRTLGTENAGGISIIATELVEVSGSGRTGSFEGSPSGLFTLNSSIPNGGRSGNVSITSPQLSFLDGAIIDTRTSNNRAGGNIDLAVGNLNLFRGGQLLSTSDGAGSAGSIDVVASESVEVSGVDNTFDDRVEAFPSIGELNQAQSNISVRAQSSGAAGDISFTTPELTVRDQGQIIAESASGDGGGIEFSLGKLLLLRTGGLITATAGTAQTEGDGGNIIINSPFVVAIPNENSDITANAFSGDGGNINITARGIFGIVPRESNTPLSDITASSEIGVNGVIALNVLDAGFIENNLNELPDSLTSSEDIVASSCVSRSNTIDGTFSLTGSDRIPQTPTDAPSTPYSVGTVQTLPTTTAIAEPNTIIEPSAIYELADGRLVMSKACQS